MSIIPLVASVLNILNVFIQQPFFEPITGAHEELERLSSAYISINAVLEDAERKQLQGSVLNVWLERLRSITYELDDLLDEWGGKELRSQFEESCATTCMKQISKFSIRCFCGLCCCRFDPLVDQAVLSAHTCVFNMTMGIRMGRRLRRVREKLDMIFHEKNCFNLAAAETRGNNFLDRETTAMRNELDPPFGRGRQTKSIVSKLTSERRKQKEIYVLAIVGMGGVGKTTLAQIAYNNDTVRKYFDFTFWICVSDDFDVKRLTRDIVISIAGSCNGYEQMSLDQLQHQLRQKLAGKRFLLVLDDVCDDNLSKWESFKLPLGKGKQGTKIVLTTRQLNIAKTMGGTDLLKLEPLSNSQCRLLFESIAFANKNIEDHPELAFIGRKIVKKLNGLPLAAKVMGGVMRSKETKQEWEAVLQNDLWEERGIEHNVFRPLLLSYYDLPLPLKQCFAYCSMFPKGYQIDKNYLIKLWMAQSFLGSNDLGSDLEGTGHKYFNDLIRRSLFQQMKQDNSVPHLVCCSLHDLVHDMAQYISRRECHVFDRESMCADTPSYCRHASIQVSPEVETVPAFLSRIKNLRTLVFLGGSSIELIPSSLFYQLKFLRSLDLSNSRIKELPGSVKMLIHLRYLNLSMTLIKKLPESLVVLCNLQTLLLDGCPELCRLPERIGEMVSLRHLRIQNTPKLRYLPEGVKYLYSLRSLSDFIVGGKGGLKIAGLKYLDFLRGELHIHGLEKVGTVEEATEAELLTKKNMYLLHLHTTVMPRQKWKRLGSAKTKRMEQIFEALQPHQNLVDLGLFEYIGSQFPSWMTMLTNLSSLTLYNCRKCVQLPPLGILPSLRSIYIHGLDKVKHVGAEFYGSEGRQQRSTFPRLQELYFEDMPNWGSWEMRWENGQGMPSLEKVVIGNCPKLSVLPPKLPLSFRQ